MGVGDHVNGAISEGRLPMVSGELLLLRNTLLLRQIGVKWPVLLPKRLLHLLRNLLLPQLPMRWLYGICILFLLLL